MTFFVSLVVTRFIDVPIKITFANIILDAYSDKVAVTTLISTWIGAYKYTMKCHDALINGKMTATTSKYNAANFDEISKETKDDVLLLEKIKKSKLVSRENKKQIEKDIEVLENEFLNIRII